jgi:ribosome-associated translation inhibitor RaiA
MIKVIFKNMERSELAQKAVTDRLDAVVGKFPDLTNSEITVTLEMLNSPVQAGPDLFSIKIHIHSGRYRGIRLQKSSPNLYVALADAIDHILEVLNRFGDRVRVKERNRARALTMQAPEARDTSEAYDDILDEPEYEYEWVQERV